ncbi:MAG: ABC transporter ATP-binding protein, partial [Eubacterium sp.]|nr:ABC transporter ATP-binding protein [Eubacterium sp.]
MAKKSLAMKIENVSMKFNLSSEKVDNIKEYVIKMIKKELMFQEFWALRDISFEVQKGDRVGIMG